MSDGKEYLSNEGLKEAREVLSLLGSLSREEKEAVFEEMKVVVAGGNSIMTINDNTPPPPVSGGLLRCNQLLITLRPKLVGYI